MRKLKWFPAACLVLCLALTTALGESGTQNTLIQKADTAVYQLDLTDLQIESVEVGVTMSNGQAPEFYYQWSPKQGKLGEIRAEKLFYKTPTDPENGHYTCELQVLKLCAQLTDPEESELPNVPAGSNMLNIYADKDCTVCCFQFELLGYDAGAVTQTAGDTLPVLEATEEPAPTQVPAEAAVEAPVVTQQPAEEAVPVQAADTLSVPATSTEAQVFVSFSLRGEELRISGQVLEADKQPLRDQQLTVLLFARDAQFVRTDHNGYFFLRIPAMSKLDMSQLNMFRQEMVVTLPSGQVKSFTIPPSECLTREYLFIFLQQVDSRLLCGLFVVFAVLSGLLFHWSTKRSIPKRRKAGKTDRKE